MYSVFSFCGTGTGGGGGGGVQLLFLILLIFSVIQNLIFCTTKGAKSHFAPFVLKKSKCLANNSSIIMIGHDVGFIS